MCFVVHTIVTLTLSRADCAYKSGHRSLADDVKNAHTHIQELYGCLALPSRKQIAFPQIWMNTCGKFAEEGQSVWHLIESMLYIA